MLAFLLAAFPLPVQAAKPAPPTPVPITKPYKLNLRTEDELSLPDLEGQLRSLYAEHPSQPIVLVFWGYRDPVSLFYAPHLAELAKRYAGKAGFYLVNSNYDELVSAGDALAKLREIVAREKVALPVLVDRDNRLADDFEATANGQVFLLDSNHFLRYHGGIDDDPRGERRKEGLEPRTWLENALNQVLAGERPKENWTRPSGRAIKRAPKDGVPSGSPKK
jgi:thiol-disulfide isomerase/thioredoxin